jgi:protein-disulfide isomerase
MTENKQNILLIATAILLVLAFIAGAVMYKQQSAERLGALAKANQQMFVPQHAPRLGNDKAKVQIVEFLDPECESCRAAHPHVKELLRMYPEQVQLIVRYVPLHHNSEIAIRALEAARMQGKYWEALDLLFHYQPQWGDHHAPKPEVIFDVLPKIFVDVKKIRANMTDPRITAIIDQDIADGEILGVRGTPTFFVNGNLVGMQGLRAAVKREVDKHY